MLTVSITIFSIEGTDNFFIGWRLTVDKIDHRSVKEVKITIKRSPMNGSFVASKRAAQAEIKRIREDLYRRICEKS